MKKNKKKKGLTMRVIETTEAIVFPAVESFLFSMRMIDGDEKVVNITTDENFTKYYVHLERQGEPIN